MKSVIITGADRGLGLSLCKEYLSRGYTVFAGKILEEYSLLEDLREKDGNLHIISLDVTCRDSIIKARDVVSAFTGGKLDVFISNAALMGGGGLCRLYEAPMDMDFVWNTFSVNALGPVRMVELFLPLMDESNIKRLCFVSSEVSCINLMKNRAESNGYAYPMSKSAMNMAVRLMHNQLYERGYTFRLFHPGWMKHVLPDGSRREGAMYDPDFVALRAVKYFETPLRDEQRLVMYDFKGLEWPF